MQKLLILVIACILLGTRTTHAALAAKTIVGVNVVGVQQMNEQQQDALIEQLRQNGVETVRTGIGEKYVHFIIRAYQRGIGTVVIVYPTQEGRAVHTRPADKPLGLQWAEPAITDADPSKFKSWLAIQLAPLEAAGVHLAAFELGNEINGQFFNGDFLPAQASGRVLSLSDLNNPHDAEGKAIAASYRSYLKVMEALKDLRDHSKLNRTTPIISAGLADGGLPGKRPGQRLDGVSIAATLEFLRQNGMDSLVDGYGVHGGGGGGPNTPVSARVAQLTQDTFAECSTRKRCWLTEWSFANGQGSCPIDDTARMKTIENMRGALRQFAQQGKLAAILFYSWSGPPAASGIFRCGSLTGAGKLALSPMQ